MLNLRILGLATYLPRRRVDNVAMLSSFPELSERDFERIGVSNRHEADDDEDVPAMAVHASKAALERANVAAESLDFLILVNWSERRYVPDIAPRVQACWARIKRSRSTSVAPAR